MELEKTFNDFSKLVDVFAEDARIFRDNISGKVSYKEKKSDIFYLNNSVLYSHLVEPSSYGTIH